MEEKELLVSIYENMKSIKEGILNNNQKLGQIYELQNYRIKNKYNKICKEDDEQFSKLSDYEKIILKDLDSRISILEEETDNYKK